MKYKHGDIDTGDYLAINLCDRLYKVTDFDDEYIELVDSSGTVTECAYSEVHSITLPSEMDYAF